MHKKVTIQEIYKYLKEEIEPHNQKVRERAQKMYSESFSNDRRDLYIKRHSINPLSKRTIERCVSKLVAKEQVEKDRDTYFISDAFRFGKDSVYPEHFRRFMYAYILSNGFNFQDKSQEYKVMELVRRFGVLLMFCFIEASRPTRQKTMSIRDREDLVSYRIKKSISLRDMYDIFFAVFGYWSHFHDWSKGPMTEMKEYRIRDLLRIMKRSYPDLYSNFIEGKRAF